MGTEAEDSVTGWIGDLKNGEPDAAGRLWQRYSAGLVRLARRSSKRSRGPRRTRTRKTPPYAPSTVFSAAPRRAGSTASRIVTISGGSWS